MDSNINGSGGTDLHTPPTRDFNNLRRQHTTDPNSNRKKVNMSTSDSILTLTPFNRLPPPSAAGYEDTFMLYLMHLGFTLISRTWDMGIVLLIASLVTNPIFLIGIIGFISSFVIFCGMSSVGIWLDKTDRLQAIKIVLWIKVISITSAYICCSSLPYYNSSSNIFNMKYAVTYFLIPIFYATASLSLSTINQSIEKDWIVVLANNNSAWLSNTNSTLSTIDLGCSAIAPVITGLLFAFFTNRIVAIILLFSNIFVTIILFYFTNNLYDSCIELSFKRIDILYNNTPNTYNVNVNSSKSEDGNRIPNNNNFTPPRGLNQFSYEKRDELFNYKSEESNDKSCFSYYSYDFMVASGCAGVMISYAFLFLTVLSYGNLMTVYVKWAEISIDWIGVSRGLSALTGFIGAAIFPWCHNRFGLWHSAQWAIIYQCILVIVAASSFFRGSHSESAAEIIILCVLFSRTGLWLFDLCVRQIAQESIPEDIRGKVNGQWRSLTALFEMSSFGLAIIFPDPHNFWILTSISATMVFLAMITYTLSNRMNEKCLKFVFNPLQCCCCCYSSKSQQEQSFLLPVHQNGNLDRGVLNRYDAIKEHDDFEMVQLAQQ
eukprot:gene10061-13521_t